MIAISLFGAALATSVYINGVRADVLPEVTLANSTVRIDAQGNIWIDAPGYRVSVVSQPQAQPYAAPGTTPPSLPPYGPPPTTNTGTYGTPSGAATTPAYSPPPAPTSGVAAGQWWLVTEDNSSAGHTIEVVVNGTLVRRIVSGEPQLILDLGPFLRPGANAVVLNAIAGPQPSGGVFNVYVGKGNNNSGTIRIDTPEIRFSRRATDNANGTSKQYTINVN